MEYESSKSDRWARIANLTGWQRAIYTLRLADLHPIRWPATEDDRLANWMKMDQALAETIEITEGTHETPLKESLEEGSFGRDAEIGLS